MPTMAEAESMALMASAAFSALPSWSRPMVMLMMMTPMMRPEDGKGTKESGAKASVWLHDMTKSH